MVNDIHPSSDLYYTSAEFKVTIVKKENGKKSLVGATENNFLGHVFQTNRV